MQEPRQGQAERAAEQNLARRGSEKIIASNHLGDALRVVIHNRGELVGSDAVVAEHDEIAQLPPHIETARAVQRIIKFDECGSGLSAATILKDSRRRGAEAPPAFRREPPAWRAAGPLFRVDAVAEFPAADAGIYRAFLAFVRRTNGHLDLLPAADARIDAVGGAQFFQRLHISLPTMTLEERLTVPFQSKPTQVFHRLIDEARFHARPVEVVHAQQHAPARSARREPRDKKCARIAEVQAAARRRSESAGDGKGLTVRIHCRFLYVCRRNNVKATKVQVASAS